MQDKQPDYHTFYNQPTPTSHGGVGFFIKDFLEFNERNGLGFNSPVDFETCFVELVIHNKTNVTLGCFYLHPSSSIPVHQFNSQFIEPMLKQVASENQFCSLLGDFNINLLKVENNEGINAFHNNMTSYFFSPSILQPTSPSPTTLHQHDHLLKLFLTLFL